MRRATAILTACVCVCTVAACRSGAAREADRGVALSRDTSARTEATRSDAAAADTVASEMDATWAIALVSKSWAPQPAREPAARRVVVVDRGPDPVEQDGGDVDLEAAMQHDAARHKSRNAKPCGVVNRRT